MGHQHEHGHTHSANKKVLTIAFCLITFFMIVEVIGGFATNSLALLSDAGHMLSDSIALLIGILAFTFGTRAVDQQKTFGYKRFEILAAVLNGLTLIVIAVIIIIEAVRRFFEPTQVSSFGMLIIAIIGLIVNIVAAYILMRGGETENNLNMRAAFLHVISDMLGSVGAIVAAILMMSFGWAIADPIASLFVAVLVLRSGYYVTKDGLHVLMEGTPKSIDFEAVVAEILRVEGVQHVHDMHIWSITSDEHAMSCHIAVEGTMTIAQTTKLSEQLAHLLLHKNIGHTTFQFESIEVHKEAPILCTGVQEHVH